MKCPVPSSIRHRSAVGARSRLAAALAALSLIVGVACATGPVDRSTDQTRRGVEAADHGSWEEAEFRWLKALAIGASNGRALNNLAIRSERAGDFEEAKERYERALEAASPAERRYVEQNWEQFVPIWERIQSGETDTEPGQQADEEGSAGDDGDVAETDDALADAGEDSPDVAPEASADADVPTGSPGVGVREILISVPDQGPNLAGYDRMLIGNFAAADDSEIDINDFAVRYFRRRITQRTFFQTQDQIERPLPPELRGDGLLSDLDFWVAQADEVDADLVLTGHIGLQTSEESRMVRERIRSPDGQVREVARFQDSAVYKVRLDYVVLRGDDGETLVEGTLEGEQSFPADESLDESEAVFEALEELLPQLLEAITPQRSEQSRYLIY